MGCVVDVYSCSLCTILHLVIHCAHQIRSQDPLNSHMNSQGLYQDKPSLPFIPGSEVSGIVIDVGQKVKSLKPGDHVRS